VDRAVGSESKGKNCGFKFMALIYNDLSLLNERNVALAEVPRGLEHAGHYVAPNDTVGVPQNVQIYLKPRS
jgi:hypothetical protein